MWMSKLERLFVLMPRDSRTFPTISPLPNQTKVLIAGCSTCLVLTSSESEQMLNRYKNLLIDLYCFNPGIVFPL